jgi:hypothetical protein
MVASVMGMQGADMAPNAAMIDACTKQNAVYTSLMAKWSAIKAKANGPNGPRK